MKGEQTMDDYIKREDAVKAIEYAPCYYADHMYQDDALDAIKDVPAADVQENVRGEWILDDDDDCYELWKCSACGNGIFDHRYDFCPNCGADMRLRDKE